MCDVCSNKNRNSCESVNCLKEANVVVDILEKNNSKEKEKRLTANKLAELVYNELNSKSKKSNYPNSLSQTEVEHLILQMLMRQFLKEDFHFTPYSTICYLVLGELGHLIRSQTRFEINLLKNSKRKLDVMKDEDIICTEVSKKNNGSNHKNGSSNGNNENTDDDDDLIVLDYGEDDDDYVSFKKKIKK
jgi:ATP-dependent DNA helicase Q1